MKRTAARAWITAAALTIALTVQAQKPPPQPSTPVNARDNSQAAQLPAGPDNGVPGSAQNAPLGTEASGEIRRGGLLKRRVPESAASAAARTRVDDSAAARLAARKPGDISAKPAAAASSPGQPRKP